MQELNPIEWALRPMRKYAVFTGRAPRAEYWWFYLGTMIVSIPVAILDKAIGETGALSAVYNLAILLPWLGVSVRRLHDTDRSGWWLFLFFVPFLVAGFVIGFFAAGARLGGSDPNPFNSMGGLMIASIIALIIIALVLIIFMILPGTPGSNRYGPDPYDEGGDLEEVFA